MTGSVGRKVAFCLVCLALGERPSEARAGPAASPAADTLRVMALATNDSSGHDFQRGVELGVAEARTAGAARELEVTQSYTATLGDVIRAAADAVERGAVAVISFLDEPMSQQLARYLTQVGVVHINARDDANDSRRRVCARFTFHVAPSSRMSDDARRLAPVPVPDSARVVAWDPQVEQGGASSLGAAYRARFSREATADAWLGWTAVRIIYEAGSRAGSSVALRDHLESPAASFEVRKGRPLTFRYWDHQLRQPLYLLDGARLIATVPQDSSLDAIGDGPRDSRCEWVQ